MVSNVNYVKRVVFPLEVLPVSAVYANLVDVASGLVILLAALILFQSGLSPSALYFPILLIPLAFLTLGFSWFISAIGVFLRDVGQAVAVLLQLVFFMTPVIYPLSAAPESLRTVLRLNPLTIIVENARRVLIEGHPPEWTWLIVVTIASLAVFQLGYLWFMMSKRAFADVI
jgi:lipopolysaccharide transport system permease protein